jgi:adenylosuccinate synthase
MRRALVVAGLGFGDEGKGSTVDWLVGRTGAELVVRYNGGPQAAHHVVAEDGRVHCASQLGAGVLHPGVRTHLSRFMLVDPLALASEDAALRRIGVPDALLRLSIDPECIVVTPLHAIVNRIQETARGAARHGSCGRGVAQAQLDAERGAVPCIRVRDLFDRERLVRALELLRLVKLDVAEQIAIEQPNDAALASLLADLKRPDRPAALADAYGAILRAVTVTGRPPLSETVVFEGAQGVLLDRDHGFWPHVTPSRATFENARALAFEWAKEASFVRIGVIRAYATRHGEGPFVTFDAELTRARPDEHNGDCAWQGSFRLGAFDAVATRYALDAAGGVDALVMTNLDRLARLPSVRIATAYARGGAVSRELPRIDRADLGARASLTRDLREYSAVCAETAGWDEEGLCPPAQSWIESVAQALGRRIDVVSVGPKAGAKRVLGALPA